MRIINDSTTLNRVCSGMQARALATRGLHDTTMIHYVERAAVQTVHC